MTSLKCGWKREGGEDWKKQKKCRRLLIVNNCVCCIGRLFCGGFLPPPPPPCLQHRERDETSVFKLFLAFSMSKSYSWREWMSFYLSSSSGSVCLYIHQVLFIFLLISFPSFYSSACHHLSLSCLPRNITGHRSRNTRARTSLLDHPLQLLLLSTK